MSFNKTIIFSVLLITLIACSNGSSNLTKGEESESASLTPTPNTGIFIDSAVQGLHYQTESLNGTTNQAGEYLYLTGETVEFFVGNISIGTSPTGDIITPADLLNDDGEFNLNHKRNLIRFLQTIDTDGDPFNGIEIREDIDAFTENMSLDFDLPTEQFERLQTLSLLLGNATNANTLVSEEQANAHFIRSLSDLGIELSAQQTQRVDLVFNLNAEEMAPEIRTSLITASGTDINTPYLNSVGNGYSAQTFTITDPDGISSNLTISENESADQIAASLNALSGVTATSSNSVDIDFGSLSGTNTYQFSINRVPFPAGSNIQEIAAEIIYQTNNGLPFITATHLGTVLTISSPVGVNFNMSVAGGDLGTDTLVFTGSGGTSILTASSIPPTVTIGGQFIISLENHYAINDDGVSNGTLLSDPINPATVVINPFTVSEPSSYNHSTTTNVFDSLGNLHVMRIYFVKESAINTWTAYVQIDDDNVGAPNPALPPPNNEQPSLSAFSLQFNPDGSLNSSLSESISISHWTPRDASGEYNGASLSNNFIVDITGSTQFSGDFLVNTDHQDQLISEQTKTVNLAVNLDRRATIAESRDHLYHSFGSQINSVINNSTSGLQGNQYTAQTFTVTDPNNLTTDIIINDNASAHDIAQSLSQIDGVSTTSSNEVTIDFFKFSRTNTYSISLNGYTFDANATAQEIAIEINNQTNFGLPGISASILGNQLMVMANSGHDLIFQVSGGASNTDQLIFKGSGNTLTLTASSSTQQLTVGGNFVINLDENYSITTGPTAPSVIPVAGTLLSNPIISTTIVHNAFDPTLDSTFNHTTAIDIFDSLGESHVLNAYFVKENQSSTWTVYLQIDGDDIADPNPALPEPQNVHPRLALYSIVFDSDGNLNEPLSDIPFITNWTPLNTDGKYNGAFRPLTIANGATMPLLSPASSSNFVIDLTGTTQLDNDFSINALNLESFTTE